MSGGLGLVVRCAWWLRHLWLAVTTNYARMDSQNYAGVNFLYQRNIEILHEIFPCTTIISHQKLILSNWNDIFEHKCSLFILRSSKQCRSFIRSILSSSINHCLATQPTIVTIAPRATVLPLHTRVACYLFQPKYQLLIQYLDPPGAMWGYSYISA